MGNLRWKRTEAASGGRKEKTRKEVEPVKGCLYQYRKNVATASKGAYIATRNEM